MNHSIDDMAMAVLFIAFALAILTIVFAAVFSRIYRAIRAEGEAHGIIIGELREMRRRDEMNVRARRTANERLIAETLGGNEFTEEELDV
jgi:hypothetical protein